MWTFLLYVFVLALIARAAYRLGQMSERQRISRIVVRSLKHLGALSWDSESPAAPERLLLAYAKRPDEFDRIRFIRLDELDMQEALTLQGKN